MPLYQKTAFVASSSATEPSLSVSLVSETCNTYSFVSRLKINVTLHAYH